MLSQSFPMLLYALFNGTKEATLKCGVTSLIFMSCPPLQTRAIVALVFFWGDLRVFCRIAKFQPELHESACYAQM